MTRKYLVVVVDPTPSPGQGIHGSATPRHNAPQWVTASNAERAVESATQKIKPGGYAYVVVEQDVRRYSRAVEAPLVECHGDGTPLPIVEDGRA